MLIASPGNLAAGCISPEAASSPHPRDGGGASHSCAGLTRSLATRGSERVPARSVLGLRCELVDRISYLVY
eukprot:101521-Amphidinium_carterae.1